MSLTHERALELFHYCAKTGALTNRVSRGRAKAGAPAGGLHRVKGYGEVCIDGVNYQTHRLVWFIATGEWPTGEIDHRNGIEDDNRLDNLRDVPIATNRQNVREATRRKARGRLLGAHFTKGGRWAAAICVNRRQIHLGRFDTEEAAHAAYVAAKRQLHPGCTI